MSDLEALGLSVEYTSFRVELVHPETGAPLLDENNEPAWIEIEGYNSVAGDRLKKAAALKLQRQRRGGREQALDLDKAREENADALAQLTKGWHLVNLSGCSITEAFPFNTANARQLYARKDTAWITSQIGAALSEDANFIKT